MSRKRYLQVDKANKLKKISMNSTVKTKKGKNLENLNSDYILNVLETVKFVSCLQIPNVKYLSPKSGPSAVYKILSSLLIQLVRVFVTTVSNPKLK